MCGGIYAGVQCGLYDLENTQSLTDDFVSKQLQTSAKQLLVVEAEGDSTAPTIMSGEKAIVNTGHKTPSPDGLYAIRDSFGNVVIRRLQLLRAAQPSRVKIISDNPKHAAEQVALSEVEIDSPETPNLPI